MAAAVPAIVVLATAPPRPTNKTPTFVADCAECCEACIAILLEARFGHHTVRLRSRTKSLRVIKRLQHAGHNAEDFNAPSSKSSGPSGSSAAIPAYSPPSPSNVAVPDVQSRHVSQIPAVGILAGADGKIYVNERERPVRLEADGSVTPLVSDLPAWGHGNDHMVWGRDGKIYWGQGSVTNSGVMGLDNQSPPQGQLDQRGFQFRPQARDIPCEDVTLSGQNFETDDPRPGRQGQKASTGAFLAYGTSSTAGQVVKGEVPCNGAILRANPDGSGLEWVAWGFRNPYGLVQAPDGPPVLWRLPRFK